MGQTMLMWACRFGHHHIVEKLVTMGLPRKYINIQDIYGRTALMYALLYGNIDCAFNVSPSPTSAMLMEPPFR